MRSSNARDSFIVMILPRFMSNTNCPGPSMVLRPASPKELPVRFAQVLLAPGVLEPREEVGEQKAPVVNRSREVGLRRPIGGPLAWARGEPPTPRRWSGDV